MMRLLPLLLTFAGAVFGGGIPGAPIAFLFAVSTGWSGAQAHGMWLVVNLLLGVAGAFGGMMVGKTHQGTAIQRGDWVCALLLGLLAGAVGYSWLDWELRHADPPL